MRDIKFRAWDKSSSKFIYPSIIGIQLEDFAWPHGRKYIHNCQEWDIYSGLISSPKLQQFTGLFDRNGKEIYEGDIVKVSDIHTGIEGCYFDPICFVVEYDSYTGTYGDLTAYFNEQTVDQIEVVGNIYENPDMKS